MTKLLWTPSSERVQNANMTKFIQYVNSKFNQQIEGYQDLWQWSVEDPKNFWRAVWDFTGIIATKPYSEVVENLSEFPPTTQWFTGANLNFAENLLRYRDTKIALVFKSETQKPIRMSYQELYEEVAQVVQALKNMGVQKGDRIAAYMPNMMETIIAMLAASSLGATWSSCGAELGADAALDRLGQITPKVLFSIDAYWYKQQEFNHLEKLQAVVKAMPSIEKVVVIPYIHSADLSSIPCAVHYADFKQPATEIEFVQVPFNHPQYIMFSSGTTGKPKCMVQGVGGVLINHLKELILHTDLKREDKLMYLSSPSWMMWNWMTSGLAVGATIVLFDGNPLYPDWRNIWKFISDEQITIFGCSASYLHYLKNQNAQPGKEFDLSALREISQTGSALSDEGFDFVYSEIKSDLHFNSISGGTDINGCFAAGSPTLPVYSGQLQALALGMKVAAYNQNGEAVFDQQGELVCELPGPSMPIYFWEDPDNQRYQKAYFNFFGDKHVWRHGDYVLVHKDTGGITFYGRSDAILKPSGVRIGTAEIYNVVEELPEVEDSLAIGRLKQEDQEVLLFIKLAAGYDLTEQLKKKIQTELRIKASPRHVPQQMFVAPDIPYTFSGKKVESAVTNIINDRPVTNRGALRNPDCLDFYEQIAAKYK